MELGRPIVTTTHGGFTLYLANNHEFYAHLRSGAWLTPWNEGALKTRRWWLWSGETQADATFYQAARESIRNEPGMFLVSCVYRLSRMWGFLPLATSEVETTRARLLRYTVALFYLLELCCAAIGAWQIGRRWRESPYVWAALLVASFTAVHTFYWTDMRMRAPLVGVIALAATVGAARLWNRQNLSLAPSAN